MRLSSSPLGLGLLALALWFAPALAPSGRQPLAHAPQAGAHQAALASPAQDSSALPAPTLAQLPAPGQPPAASTAALDAEPPPPASTPDAKAPRRPAGPPPPRGTVFSFPDGDSAPRSFAVALDEAYFPERPAGARVLAIPPQPDLPTLLAHLAAHTTSVSTDDTQATSRSPQPLLVLYPLGAQRHPGSRRVLVPRIEVRLASPDTPSPAIAPELGIAGWERPSYAPDRALAHVQGDAAQALRAVTALAQLPGILAARPLLARQHQPRFVPNDPLFRDQWHLRNTGQQGGKAGVDIRARPAWLTATGAGIVVGVVDDGVDHGHPDLAPGYRADLSYDWVDDDPNPFPVVPGFEGDNHGTAVAGLAVARGGNAIGVVGAAPAGSLAGLRLLGDHSTDEQDAAAMSWRNDAIQIKNNSWGPPDAAPAYGYPADLNPAGPLWAAAVADAVNNGRQGRGTLFFWSAGNGHADGDQGVLDGYATDRHVIPVAAATHTGGIARFSEGGPHVVIAAPGSATTGIVTTDRRGAAGYNSVYYGFPGDYPALLDYTRGFGGTSAAAPIVSGVGALLLQTRPDLGWRDVKEILLRSGTRLQASSPEWVSRPAGLAAHPIKHHPRLGGGLLNALDALTLARNWPLLSPEINVEAGLAINLPRAIPDAGQGSVRAAFALPQNAPPLRVEHVVLTLDIRHPFRGDLTISLTSPTGVVSRFVHADYRMAGLYLDDPSTPEDESLIGAHYENHPFVSVRHWGEASTLPARPDSAWVLEIQDMYREDVGQLVGARLTLHGTPLSSPALVSAPESQSLATGSTLVLTTQFSGGNLSYSWTRNGRPVPRANGPVLRLPGISAATAGLYVCTAVNELGTATASATVTIDDGSRATFPLHAGTSQALSLSETVPGDIVLWSAAGLPGGLRLDRATGQITGRVTRPGSYRVVVSATTAEGIVIRTPLTFDFAPVAPEFTGQYAGLVSRHPALNAELGGSLTLTVNASGTATGRLVLGRAATAFTGFVERIDDDTLRFETNLPRARQRLALELRRDEGVSSLDGTLLSLDNLAAPGAELVGARSTWHARNRPATAFLGASTAALLPPESEAGLGASLLTLRVAASGQTTWTLLPADGSPALTGATALTDPGVLFLHAPYAGSLGSLRGRFTAPQTGAPPLAAETADWLRRAAPRLARPEGFGPISLALAPGSGAYSPPAAGTRVLGRDADSPLVALSLLRADGTAAFESDLGVDAANRFVVPAPNTDRLALRLAAASGRVSGNVILREPDPANPALTINRNARLEAVLLPASDRVLGFYFLPPTAAAPAPRAGLLLLEPAGP